MSGLPMLQFPSCSRSRIRLFTVPCTGNTIGLEEAAYPRTDNLLRWSLRYIPLVCLKHGPVKRSEFPP